MKRDWKDAIGKRNQEGCCRVCGTYPVEAAHVIGRRTDKRYGGTAYVNPDSIVPLCRPHHELYDQHAMDLLPYLSLAEQLQAVTDAGGIELARKRLIGRESRGLSEVAA